MALVVADRVQETTTTTGTGTLTLAGAVSGFQSFSAIGNANTTYYTIVSGTDWEVGVGTYTSSGTTLSRDTVLSSSAAGAKIVVVSGAIVFGDYPAGKAVYEDANGVITNGDTLSYSDTGILAAFASTTAGYNQTVLQNKSSGTTASTNITVTNDSGSATTNFAEFGINSSGFTGTGSFNQAGYSYVASASTDLAIGTYGANKIHFVVNSGTTDAAVIDANGNLGVGITPDGSSYIQIKAGDATHAPLELTAGTLMTTPDGGSIEYDGIAFYSSMDNSTRGVVPTEQIVVLTGTNTLTSQTAVQPIFDGGGGTTNGAITLPVGTYQYEMSFALTGMSATSGSFGFGLGGTATKTFSYHSTTSKAGTALATSQATLQAFGSAANTALQTASTGTVGTALIKGIMRVTVTGTVIPQVSLTVASAAVVQANSYFKVTPIGNATVATVGNWS